MTEYITAVKEDEWVPLVGLCAKVMPGATLLLLALSTARGLKRLLTSRAVISRWAYSMTVSFAPACVKLRCQLKIGVIQAQLATKYSNAPPNSCAAAGFGRPRF